MNWFVWTASLVAILASPVVVLLLLRVGLSAVLGRTPTQRSRWRGAVDLAVACLFGWGIVIAVVHFPWLWPFQR